MVSPFATPYRIHSAVGLPRLQGSRIAIHSAYRLHSAIPSGSPSPSRSASPSTSPARPRRLGMASPPPVGVGDSKPRYGRRLVLLSRSGGGCGGGGDGNVGCLECRIPVIPDPQPFDGGFSGFLVDDDLPDFVGIRDGGLAIENLGILAPGLLGKLLSFMHAQRAIVRSGGVYNLSHSNPAFCHFVAGGLASARPKGSIPLSSRFVKGQKGLKILQICKVAGSQTFHFCKVPPQFIKVPSSLRAPPFLHDAFFDPYCNTEVEESAWMVIETWDRILHLVREKWRGAWWIVVSEGGVIQ